MNAMDIAVEEMKALTNDKAFDKFGDDADIMYSKVSRIWDGLEAIISHLPGGSEERIRACQQQNRMAELMDVLADITKRLDRDDIPATLTYITGTTDKDD